MARRAAESSGRRPGTRGHEHAGSDSRAADASQGSADSSDEQSDVDRTTNHTAVGDPGVGSVAEGYEQSEAGNPSGGAGVGGEKGPAVGDPRGGPSDVGAEESKRNDGAESDGSEDRSDDGGDDGYLGAGSSTSTEKAVGRAGVADASASTCTSMPSGASAVHVQSGPSVAGERRPGVGARPGVEGPQPTESARGAQRQPRVSNRIMDPAPDANMGELPKSLGDHAGKAEVSGRVVDSATRHAGGKREPEPVPIRSDDVTVARLLSTMTTSLLRSQDDSAKKSPRPKRRMVDSITDQVKLVAWRDHRQQYLRELRIYNKVPGNIPVVSDPVISKVTREQRRAISEWLLLPQHRTTSGEDPNAIQCVNWILGMGEYEKQVNRVKGTQVGMIKQGGKVAKGDSR